ncbi:MULTISPECIES: hypothetical protein [unclassified Paenibacillus]|uniref:hypothetical protein n=1 Tax=unclassified Paenibacillus TaxID=185978 RepID=UPI001AE8479B|nr:MULTISPECIES: hypothetical protein [unclassified Paenibacillus]MBP1157679.1 hypothetical protein [Paenibacillus sp. PvP091]MBP1171584.1 hypothetical protein [Paenibacillus sp. PvR098]MBP2437965.1 hypothetical protein [Paenibacillus sp. PvP052]
MPKNPYNRPAHYGQVMKKGKNRNNDKEKNKNRNEEKNNEKNYYSLKFLASEVYPYLSEDRAYRNTLKNFKEACALMGKELSEYKVGRDFQIPKHLKSVFVLLIRHITIYKTGLPFKLQDYETVAAYAQDIINTKKTIDRSIDNINQDIDADDYANFYEVFYSSSDIRFILVHQLKMNIADIIVDDFRYITRHVPDDRMTQYAEHYLKQVEQIGKLLRKMTEDKIYEQ